MRDKKTKPQTKISRKKQQEAEQEKVIETTEHAILPIKSYIVENMNKLIPKIEKQIVKLEQSIEDHNIELDIKKEKLSKLRSDLSHLAYIRNNTYRLDI